jgi:hypothetical protein
MNNYQIIPSNLQYKSAPFVDQEVSVTLEGKQQEITEYTRTQTVSLAQVYDDERQSCTVFRPTFKISYLYSNTYTGTTSYIPFRNYLYYVGPEESISSGIWKGFPQYFEFDFQRPDIQDQHFSYKAKSAFTYNWTYYLTYPSENQYNKLIGLREMGYHSRYSIQLKMVIMLSVFVASLPMGYYQTNLLNYQLLTKQRTYFKYILWVMVW